AGVQTGALPISHSTTSAGPATGTPGSRSRSTTDRSGRDPASPPTGLRAEQRAGPRHGQGEDEKTPGNGEGPGTAHLCADEQCSQGVDDRSERLIVGEGLQPSRHGLDGYESAGDVGEEEQDEAVAARRFG